MKRLALRLAMVAFATATPASAQDSLATGPQAMAEFAAECAAIGQALWGRSLCGKIVLVDRATRQALTNAAPPAAGFAAAEPGSWRGVLPGEIILANTSFDWAGERWIMLLAPLPGDPVARRTLIAHEAFHAIQPALGFSFRETANAHAGEERARVLFRLEAAALARALDGRGDWRLAARDAIRFNRARQLAFPIAASDEAPLLLNEGLAEYTGYRAGHGAQAAADAAAMMPRRAAEPALARQLGYIYGPAYGLLLDRTGLNWRPLAIKGAALPVLLESAFGTDAGVGPGAGRYGYRAIAAEEAARARVAAARVAALRNAFLTAPVLRLDFDKMSIGFNPNTVEPLGDLGSVYAGGTIRDTWGTFETGGDMLLAGDWSHALVPLPANFDPARANGGEAFSLTLAEGWTLVRDADGRTVRLARQSANQR